MYRKTTITTTAGERVTMNFASEGSYKDTVETVKVEMIAKEKSPFWVTLDGRKIEHFLNRRKFDAATKRQLSLRKVWSLHWHCTTRSVL